MSIGRRFLNMARSELNSLLEIAARRGDDDDGSALHGYTEKELRDELERRQREHDEEAERRRRAAEEVDEAIYGRRRASTPPPPKGRSDAGAGGARRPPPPAAHPSEALQVQRAYAALEVPQGSDFETVRKSYRALMRKYHPDHHTGSPQKQRAANEVAQRLTESYKLLEKKLRKR
jgi:DnaJ-domain-containing protein 1